jgi:putative tryptophan/tyrosine transport system substrate-binding protein
MRRRDLMAVLGGAAVAWPRLVRAQTPGAGKLVAWISGNTAAEPSFQRGKTVFLQAMRALDWNEGKDFQIEYRFAAAQPERFRTGAAELVRLAPDAIIAQGTPGLAATLKETSSIPIVFALVADPVGQGFVASLARPGGNATGFTNFEFTMGGKWIELLKEIVPDIKRMAVLLDPATEQGNGPYFLRSLDEGAARNRVELVPLRVRDAEEMALAITSVAREGAGGLIVPPAPFTTNHSREIIDLTAQARLPAIYGFSLFTAAGGLASYGIDRSDAFRGVAIYLDRILKGARPGELPVQAPSKFDLVINLKTAKALGVTIPPTLLARANEVIE